MVGHVGIGGINPIRIQSMTTTPTMNTDGTVSQIAALAEAGCEIVRVTVPSIHEAENLKNIREAMRRRGIKVPLVADIHYTPNAAMKAVEYVEKIRINPGNFADKKQFQIKNYTDAEYEHELERVEELFRPLVERCKALGVAMRIGVNHGSLSDRIMSRYGDTPAGMVKSAIEFIEMAERYGYRDIVLSMKASNTRIMIAAYRLLAATLDTMNRSYPFHLGVTEAGEGEDGRVKSAVGIGTLLEDGIGDTIRVSLTEDPVNEIPAARAIASKYNHPQPVFSEIPPEIREICNPYEPVRRTTTAITSGQWRIGGNTPVHVNLYLSRIQNKLLFKPRPDSFRLSDRVFSDDTTIIDEWLHHSDIIYETHDLLRLKNLQWKPHVISFVADATLDEKEWNRQIHRALEEKKEAILEWRLSRDSIPAFIRKKYTQWPDQLTWMIQQLVTLCGDIHPYYFLVDDAALIYTVRFTVACLDTMRTQVPIGVLYSSRHYRHLPVQTEYHAPVLLGSLLNDGIGDLVSLDDRELTPETQNTLLFNILQASRSRISKTEWISCPSCGRTQFDIQQVLRRIKTKTAHLTGLKIAVMGCVVNGLGEMADADFGFIGSQPGKVNLYVGKTLARRNVDMNEADEALIDLIREQGFWKEPEDSL